MKKQFIIFFGLITIFLCMFPLVSFCKNTTEIKLSVYEIKVNCDENGSFTVNEDNYVSDKSFFIGNGGEIKITAIPQNGYMVEAIECVPQCDSILENETIIIKNIKDNINVNITFKPIEIPVAGIDIEENVKVEKHYWWIWVIIAVIIVVTIILYMLYKKNKNK